MNSVESKSESVVSITEKAQKEILKVIQEENIEGLSLRLFVQGGCGGITLGLGLDKTIREGDLIIDFPGFKLLIDKISLKYVQGATIDFDEKTRDFEIRGTDPALFESSGCAACGVDSDASCNTCYY